MKEQNKDRRKKKAAAWVIAALLFCAAAAVGIWYWRKLPAIRVMRGIANLTEEIKAYENPVLKEAGWEEICSRLESGAVHIDADVELVTPKIGITIPGVGLKSSIGLSGRLELSGGIDQQKQLLNGSVKLHMLEQEVMNMDVAADAENLYVTLPALFQDTLRMGTTNFGADFNASVWHELMGMTLPEDYQLTIFPQKTQETTAETGNIFSRAAVFSRSAAFAGGVAVTSSGRILETERSGQQQVCKGYFVRIEPETADIILTAVREELQSRSGGKLPGAAAFPDGNLAGEIKLEIYLDAKDRIVQLKTAEPVRFLNSAAAMEFTVDFSGTQRTADEIYCRIAIARDGDGQSDDGRSGAVQDGAAGELLIAWKGEPTDISCKKQLEVQWIPAQAFDSTGGLLSPETLSVENISIESVSMESVSMESNWDYSSGSFDIAASWSNEASYDMKLQGALEAVSAGEAVRITLDFAEIGKKDKAPVRLSGMLSVEPLSEEIIIPEESVDLFSLSVLDMIKLLMHFQAEKASGL